jgi:hypothetical protein
MQQALLRYHGNATGCIGHATKEIQHVTICSSEMFVCTYESSGRHNPEQQRRYLPLLGNFLSWTNAVISANRI